MNRREDRATRRVRQQVAFEAARILATEGQRNYAQAKHKAAHRLGLSGRGGLPSNSEIEAELKRYQALHGGSERLDRVREMRRAALRAMHFFAPFRPRLVGPVLEGTADRHSRISLHLFCESAEELLAFLHRQRIAFEQEERRIRWHDGSTRVLELVVIEADGQAFELAIMHGPAGRQPPPDPVAGRTQRRAGPAELERLIEESAGDDALPTMPPVRGRT